MVLSLIGLIGFICAGCMPARGESSHVMALGLTRDWKAGRAK